MRIYYEVPVVEESKKRTYIKKRHIYIGTFKDTVYPIESERIGGIM